MKKMSNEKIIKNLKKKLKIEKVRHQSYIG